MAIPKKIFTIWLSEDGSMPELVRRCIESQKIPGYEHRLITLENCFKDSVYLQQCLNSPHKVKRWAKTADYLRVYYLETEGGIYLDADVEILPGKNFDTLLDNEVFVGTEEGAWLGSAVIGAEKGHPFLTHWRETAEKNFRGDDTLCFESSMKILTSEYYYWRDKYPKMAILDRSYFYPYYHSDGTVNFTDNSITYHHFMKSWTDPTVLPRVSILLPTLGRPEGVARCLHSIEKLNYPQDLIEVLQVEDEPRQGVPKRVKELFEKSTGEYIVYAANDMEFTCDSVKAAVIEMQRNQKGLLAFNSGTILPDEGNICEHFMIRRDLVGKIGGEIFDTDFNHYGVDNLLWHKCKRLGEAMRSNTAVIIHHHYSKKPQLMDAVYQAAMSRQEHDRELLREKICAFDLEDMSRRIRERKNFSITKVGDGEMACIRDGKGENCDQQKYSMALADDLLRAYRFLAQQPDVMLTVQHNPKWRLPDVEEFVFSGLSRSNFNYWGYDVFVHRDDGLNFKRHDFYKTIKDSNRPKIFVGNTWNLNNDGGVKKLLNLTDWVVTPLNAYDEIDRIREELLQKLAPDAIVLFAAGLVSKVLMADVLSTRKDATCVDVGSAFDPIFIGPTRTIQTSKEDLLQIYADMLSTVFG